MNTWEPNGLDLKLIQLALDEDLGFPLCDLTANILFGEDSTIYEAIIFSKETKPVVMSGVAFLETFLQYFMPLKHPVRLHLHCQDGAIIHYLEPICTLQGSAKMLSMVERILLNFLQNLSAIATLTHQFVSAIDGTFAKILDTRKTRPGFRHLSRYAVQCGGGVNHRDGLYAQVMVKDNHIDWLGGMEAVLERLPIGDKKQYPVIVEVRDQNELDVILKKGHEKVDRVLLDNMSIDQLRASVALCKGKIQTEASGNVNLSTVRLIAETGVDFISIGQLTHSAQNLDLSMKRGI